MTDELKFILAEDGTFKEYNDEYDITIHCESQAEQDEVLAKLNGEQEPKADGDCISRQAVIQHICEDKFCYKESCKGNVYKRCPDTMWVYDLPSINPQEPKADGKDTDVPKAYRLSRSIESAQRLDFPLAASSVSFKAVVTFVTNEH